MAGFCLFFLGAVERLPGVSHTHAVLPFTRSRGLVPSAGASCRWVPAGWDSRDSIFELFPWLPAGSA